MRVTLYKLVSLDRPGAGAVCETISCDSAYVRDGVLFMCTTDGGVKSERGVPVHRLDDFIIVHDPTDRG